MTWDDKERLTEAQKVEVKELCRKGVGMMDARRIVLINSGVRPPGGRVVLCSGWQYLTRRGRS